MKQLASGILPFYGPQDMAATTIRASTRFPESDFRNQ
jgi:hypothetical protein